ncbi:hypothetical protein HDV00_001946 [Rhizophlyctis rosea]|nr:hypothetical protein HDV00_001946 [Rhizophlyctis rosea]
MFMFKAAVVAAMLRRGPATAGSYTPRAATSSPFVDVAFAGTGPAGFKPSPAFDPAWVAGKGKNGISGSGMPSGAGTSATSGAAKASRTSNPPPPPPPGSAELAPRIPPILSAICLAILAHKANVIRRERQRRLQIASMTMNTTTAVSTSADKRIRLKGLDVKLHELIKGVDSEGKPLALQDEAQREAQIPVEAVVAAGHLLQRWTGRDPPAFMGQKLKLFPPLDVIKVGLLSSSPFVILNKEKGIKRGFEQARNDHLLMDESDADVLTTLNQQYPPLLDITGEGPVILSEPAIETTVTLSSAPATLHMTTTPAAAALTKPILAHLTDTAQNLATQILTLVTSWLGSTSSLLSKKLLPSELHEEINFLSEYIRLCVQAEQVLQLPLMFPGEYEVDGEGGVVGLKRPVGVFLVRMLARGVVGGVVGLAMYLGMGKKHLPVEDEESGEGGSDSEGYGGDEILAIMEGDAGIPMPVVSLESLRLDEREKGKEAADGDVMSTAGQLSTSPSATPSTNSVYEAKAAASTLPSPPPTPAPGVRPPYYSFASSSSAASSSDVAYSSGEEMDDQLRMRRMRLPERLMRLEYEMFVGESGDEGDGEEEDEFDEDGVDAW